MKKSNPVCGEKCEIPLSVCTKRGIIWVTDDVKNRKGGIYMTGHKIITIGREFGSGGRTVAKLAAEKLGYDFYDNEIILKVAKESGLSQEIVEKYDEYATYKNSFLYSIAMNAGADAYGGMSFASQVQIAQIKIIMDLAEKGSCLFRQF